MEDDANKNIVQIDVGGRMFKCMYTTLDTFPTSRLAILVQGGAESKTSFYFDRSSDMFEHILDCYRTGSVHFPRDVCPSRFIEEMEFWGLSVDDLALCCWKTFCKADDVSQTMDAMGQHIVATTKVCEGQCQGTTLRQKIWMLIDNPRSSRVAYVWAIWMTCVISTTTLITALESMDAFRINATQTERDAIDLFRNVGGMPAAEEHDYSLPHPALYVIDMACFVFITVEIVLKGVSCPNKWDLVKSFMHWLEFAACVSFWTSVLLDMNVAKLDTNVLIMLLIIFKYLSMLKLVRLFRITRHMASFRIIYLTLYSSKHEFATFTILLSLLACLFGFSIYAAEYFLTSNKFDTVFRALYWAVITLTTVGYGDMIPSSSIGQVIASLCALCGILVLAMPTGIIVSKFYHYYVHHVYMQRYVETHKQTLCH